MSDELSVMDSVPASALGDDSRELSAEDREFLRQVGQTFVSLLFSASKTVQLYDMKNRATQRVLNDLVETLRTLYSRESRAVIRVSNDFLLLNEYRIPADSQYLAPF
jgi:hypothetical protein